MIYHIVVGDFAAKQLQEGILLDEEIKGEILVLKDTLGIGPIHDIENLDTIRTEFWNSMSRKEEVSVQDSLQIQSLINSLVEGDQVWFWLAPNVSDTCAYFWLLQYFKDYPGYLHTININALPFFNEKGTLYYPNSFGLILPREIVKCKKLLKDVSLADMEVDGDDWLKLVEEKGLIRTFEGNKKIKTQKDDYYDMIIMNQLQFVQGFVKANKVLSHAHAKIVDTVSDSFLEYRLRLLITEGRILVQGDASKALKDFEISKFGS
jgi:hypothetical protein